MSKKEKLMQKFLNNPTSLRYSELKNLLLGIGFINIPAKGSHCKFKHHLLKNDLVIPVHNGDCKNFYKKEVYKIIQKII